MSLLHTASLHSPANPYIEGPTSNVMVLGDGLLGGDQVTLSHEGGALLMGLLALRGGRKIPLSPCVPAEKMTSEELERSQPSAGRRSSPGTK